MHKTHVQYDLGYLDGQKDMQAEAARMACRDCHDGKSVYVFTGFGKKLRFSHHSQFKDGEQWDCHASKIWNIPLPNGDVPWNRSMVIEL